LQNKSRNPEAPARQDVFVIFKDHLRNSWLPSVYHLNAIWLTIAPDSLLSTLSFTLSPYFAGTHNRILRLQLQKKYLSKKHKDLIF